jgi:uncharacterized protein (TIGR02246 family)
MKTLMLIVLVTVTLAWPAAAQGTRAANATEAAIAAVIAQYNRGLNDGDLNAVVTAFAPDGVWMVPNAPSVSGEAFRQWYINYWNNTVAKLQFTPELIRVEGKMAYAVVRITGTTTPKAGGASRQQDNKTIFVLRQGTDGNWKIAHYILNSNKPA